MNDREKLSVLEHRLKCLESKPVSSWERPIHDVARLAIETEITEIGRRLFKRGYLGRTPQG